MKTGRPSKKELKARKISVAMTKFTDDVIRKLEEAFILDASIPEACFYAGIGESTYYDNVKKRPELSERFKALRNNPVLSARKAVIEAFEEDPNLALKYLERKRKDEFATKQEFVGESNLSVSFGFDKLLSEIRGKKPEDDTQNAEKTEN